MKITIFNNWVDFSKEQQEKLQSIAEVIYTKDRNEYPLKELIHMVKGSSILMVDPDNLGGFEKAKEVLVKIMEALPSLRGITLDTTDVGWVDLNYCKKRGIIVCNLPSKVQTQTIAEYTIALIFGLAKRIFISDRRYQKGTFQLEPGVELKGKTLGIIGLGNIGSKVAELGSSLGMKIIAHNRSSKTKKGVQMKKLEELLLTSDVISIHATHSVENRHMVGEPQLKLVKRGVLLVNTADRELVDEHALAKAIKSGQIAGYAYEGEDLVNTPLANLDQAIGLKAIGWYTKEALERVFETWIENTLALAQGRPKNVV